MGWLSKLFNLEMETEQPASGRASKRQAYNRLKIVLMHDRTQLSAETIEKIRAEMIQMVSTYVDVDQDSVGLDFESEGDTIALVANIPILRVRGLKEANTPEGLPRPGTVTTAQASTDTPVIVAG